MKKFLLLSPFIVLLAISSIKCDLVIQSAKKEVFGFTDFVPERIYKKYDLNKISVLVFLDNNFNFEFLEYAKSKNVRIYLTGKYPYDKLGDKKFQEKWSKEISQTLYKLNIDGFNLDFSYPINKNDAKRDQLTSLVRLLKEKLSDQGAEFSFMVPWSPINKNDTPTNGQDYDWLEIIKYCDYILIKSFHINSQIFVGSEYEDEVCLAKSNQGFFESAAGLLKWLYLNETTQSKKFSLDYLTDYKDNELTVNYLNDELNIRNKVILVHAWFGLDYTCMRRVERQRCLIAPVSNFDANCSDKVAIELKYNEIIEKMIDKKLELFYDPHSRSTYLEFSENTFIHQIWFDYIYDYALKYTYARQFNLRGMGIYALNYLDYESEKQASITNSMWSLIPEFE